MGRRAREISATNLHERLPVVNPRDELGSMATFVNDLLARLEAAFEQQRRFIADASHELRTPVAIIRSEAEVALTAPAAAENEYRDALRVVQDAAARLSRIVNDLFLLTRADAGHQTMRMEELYLNGHDRLGAVDAEYRRRSRHAAGNPVPAGCAVPRRL
jgi:signal transduction histidine kinase